MAQITPLTPFEDAATSLNGTTSPNQTSHVPNTSLQKHTRRLTTGFSKLPPPTQYEGDHPLALSPKYHSPSESVRSSPRIAAQPVSPTDPSHFLTTMAAQERRVLELREELQKAEKDLASLKKQWAVIEANRKKDGVRHVEQLQPLSALHVAKTDVGGEIPMPLNPSTFEKLAAKPARKPQQRVFSGSRHTRTLSLLTPTTNTPISFPPPFSGSDSAVTPGSDADTVKPSLSRSTTMPNAQEALGFGRTYRDLTNRRSMPPPSTDALVKTGKQMASDLKDGLWTFFEDIRQATVGEEGINGKDSRVTTSSLKLNATSKRLSTNGAARKKRPSTRLQKPNGDTGEHGPLEPGDSGDPGIQAEQSFWKEFGVDTPGRKRPSPQEKPSEPPIPVEQSEGTLVDIDDNWDAWDTPVVQDETSQTCDTDNTQDPDNTEGAALPFPKLSRLTPSKLTRTVSDLMRDWESSGPEQGSVHIDEDVLASPHV